MLALPEIIEAGAVHPDCGLFIRALRRYSKFHRNALVSPLRPGTAVPDFPKIST